LRPRGRSQKRLGGLDADLAEMRERVQALEDEAGERRTETAKRTEEGEKPGG
jgi:hypothetical protein